MSEGMLFQPTPDTVEHFRKVQDECRAFDRKHAARMALFLAEGRTEAEARAMADEALRNCEPTEAMRYDAVRAEIILARAARKASERNPAVERMMAAPSRHD